MIIDNMPPEQVADRDILVVDDIRMGEPDFWLIVFDRRAGYFRKRGVLPQCTKVLNVEGEPRWVRWADDPLPKLGGGERRGNFIGKHEPGKRGADRARKPGRNDKR